MTAPTLSARGTPAGIKLKDGYQVLKSFDRLPTFSVWEKTVKPISMDGGEPIDQTTQLNSVCETMAAQSLIKYGPSTMTCAYDPNMLEQAKTYLINRNGGVTDHYPDGSTITYWGYLQKIDPTDHKRGEQPEVTITVVVTNADNSGNEVLPVVVSVSGT